MTHVKVHAKIHVVDLSTDKLKQLANQYPNAYPMDKVIKTKTGFALVAIRPRRTNPTLQIALVTHEIYTTRIEAEKMFVSRFQYSTPYDSWEIVDDVGSKVITLF